MSLALVVRQPLQAAAGIEGASFLDIPVGAQPGALGSAFTALADNSYAPVWNPGALPFVKSPEASAMHLVYLESVHYEFLSFAMPLGKKLGGEEADEPARRGLGFAVQYLGTSDIPGRDDQGNPIGDVKASNGAYTMAYGQSWGKSFGLGAAAKVITESIADVSGKAYAGDLGMFYRPHPRFRIGAGASNWGTDLKLVEQKDPLASNARLGLVWTQRDDLEWSAEGTYHRNGILSGHFGGQWRANRYFSMRGGYSTAHTSGLTQAAGFTAGLGIFLAGQEFAYAWVPYGPLGSTHYFTVSLRFRKPDNEDEEVHLQPAEARAPETRKKSHDEWDSIYDLLNDDERKAIQHPGR